MNRPTLLVLALGASLAFSACCSTSQYHPHYQAATKYRVDMAAGCQDGKDVWNWQCFLIEHNYGLQHHYHGPTPVAGHPAMQAPGYPSGHFDAATAEATMRFQGSGCRAEGIAINGTFTFATYLKAVQEGLPDYGWSQPPAKHHPFHHRNPHTMSPGPFRDGPMSLGCFDGGNGDVNAWQTFLQDAGWLGAGYPDSDFDSPTQSYTMIFQKTAKVKTSALGRVDHATWLAAKSYGPFPLQSTSDTPTVCNLWCPHP